MSVCINYLYNKNSIIPNPPNQCLIFSGQIFATCNKKNGKKKKGLATLTKDLFEKIDLNLTFRKTVRFLVFTIQSNM
jgi:hypothetical protein